MQLVHTCYRVSDLDRSLDFYAKLGFHEVVRLPLPGGTGHMVFIGTEDDRPRLELCFEPAVKPPAPEDNYQHIGLSVEDIDAVLERLAQEGIEPLMPPFAPVPPPPGQPETRITFITDPDGYKIELLENYPL